MALKDQPYIPLYVQDVLTDEKLIECSAESQGVYFRLICVLHKQENYGKFLLKAKFKQNPNQISNFAQSLVRSLALDFDVINKSLEELIESEVIYIDGDFICQKRMVKDGELSIIRSESGKKGGIKVTKQYGQEGYLYFMSDLDKVHRIGTSKKPQNRLYRLRSDNKLTKSFEIIDSLFVTDMGKIEDEINIFFNDEINGEWLKGSYENLKEKFVLFKANYQVNNKANSKAKPESNAEYENENNNIEYLSNSNSINSKDNTNTREKKKFVKPTIEEIQNYCNERENQIDSLKFYNYYESIGWRVGNKPMKDWKAAVRTWENNDKNKANYNETEQQQQHQRFIGRQSQQQIFNALEHEQSCSYDPRNRE